MSLISCIKSLLTSNALVHELAGIIFTILFVTSSCADVYASLDVSKGPSPITPNPHAIQLNVSEKIELKQRDPLTRVISGKDVQRFSVRLLSGQCASVAFQWRGIDLNITVLKPGGETLFKYPISVGASGSLPLLIISDLDGAYALEVRSSGTQASGSYQVMLEDIYPSTSSDAARIAALALVIEGERSRDQPLAIEKFVQAISLWQQTQDKAGEAYTSQRLARLYIVGDTKNATKFYDAAIQLRRELGNLQQLGYTLRDIAADYMNFNPPDLSLGQEDARLRALEYFEQAAEAFRQIGDLNGQGSSLYSLGLAHIRIGDIEKGLKAYEAALTLRRSTKDLIGEAQTLNGIGGVYSIRGDQELALEHFGSALSIFEQEGDRYRQAVAKNNIGLAYHNWGNFQKAREYYDEALAIVESLSDPNNPARCKNVLGQPARICNLEASVIDNLSELDNSFDQPEAALERLQRSEPIRRDLYFRQELGSTIARKAYSFYLISRHDPLHAKDHLNRALEACQEALSHQPAKSDWAGRALTLTFRGMVETALGELNQAVASYQEALGLQRKTGERRAQAITLDSQGQVHVLMRQTLTALKYYEEALQIWRDIKDEDGETITLFNVATAETTRGHLSEAELYLASALSLVEARRGNLTSQQLRASYFANKKNYYELDIDLKMQLSRAGTISEYVQAGLEGSEKARARIFLENLAEAGIADDIQMDTDRLDPELANLIKEKLAVQASLNKKAQFRTRLLSGKHTTEQVAAIDKIINEIKNRYDQLDSRIRTLSPRFAALTKPEPLGAKQIQQLLEGDTLLLEYFLGEKRSYAWVVATNSIQGLELPGRDQIEKLAHRVSEAVIERNRQVKNETWPQTLARINRAEAEYQEASAALSKMIIEPVAHLLDKTRLVIVADGALQTIPFAALPIPSNHPSNQNARAANSRNPEILQPRSIPIITAPTRTTHDGTRATLNAAAIDAAARESAAVSRSAPVSRLLINEHEIISLPSASVLALQRRELKDRKPAPYAVAVLADPVFELTDERVARATRGAGQRNRETAGKEQVKEAPPNQSPPTSIASAAQSKESSPLARALRDVGIDGNLPRLGYSRREATAISRAAPRNQSFSALDFKANRQTATSPELAKYRVIHFATHGVMDLEHPELSGIVLSMVDEKGQPQDGYLRLHEIYNLNLPAELVVLSGCQTGVGKQIKGEGLIALTRGFMYAGARSVVASLWKVEDSATAELMAEFYRQMFTHKLKPAAALRAAQIKMSQQKAWQSPYYWAGFFLQGEWN